MAFERQGHSASHTKLGIVMDRETTLCTWLIGSLTSKSSKLHFRFVLCWDTGGLLVQGQRNDQGQKLAAAGPGGGASCHGVLVHVAKAMPTASPGELLLQSSSSLCVC